MDSGRVWLGELCRIAARLLTDAYAEAAPPRRHVPVPTAGDDRRAAIHCTSLFAARSRRCGSLPFPDGAAPRSKVASRRFGQHVQGSVQGFPCRDLADFVGEVDDLGDLRVRQAGLSRAGDEMLDTG